MGNLGDRLPAAAREALAGCRGHFTSALMFSALVNILYLAPTLYMMQVYDRVVPTGGVTTLLALTLVLAAAIGTIAMLEAVRSRLMVKASLRLDEGLARAILARLIAKGQGGRGDPSSAQAMREFDTVRLVITAPTLIGIFDAPWTPIYVLAAVLIHPLLGLFVVCAGAILVLLTVYSDRATRRLTRTAHGAATRSAIVQEDIAQHAELIRALGMGVRWSIARLPSGRRARRPVPLRRWPRSATPRSPSSCGCSCSRWRSAWQRCSRSNGRFPSGRSLPHRCC